MKVKYSIGLAIAIATLSWSAAGQARVVVNDPTAAAAVTQMTASDEALINKEVLPAIKKQFTNDPCEVAIETAGVIKGSFSRPNAKQTLVFYQICQTGNGFGFVGLVLIDNGKIVGSFASDGGWSNDIRLVPDINKNGLSEFTLAYSGGLHQGAGGVGVDLMEFSGGVPAGIGWYQAESFGETQASTVWKLTAKPGPAPVYYRQKYFSGEGEKWRPQGKTTVVKLGKPYSKFSPVK